MAGGDRCKDHGVGWGTSPPYPRSVTCCWSERRAPPQEKPSSFRSLAASEYVFPSMEMKENVHSYKVLSPEEEQAWNDLFSQVTQGLRLHQPHWARPRDLFRPTSGRLSSSRVTALIAGGWRSAVSPGVRVVAFLPAAHIRGKGRGDVEASGIPVGR
jgi:hypothetical protein